MKWLVRRLPNRPCELGLREGATPKSSETHEDTAIELAPEILLALFAIAFVAGWVDSIAGGGALLTIPALMIAGLPPAAAIATNKISGSFGTLTAATYFVRRGYIDFRKLWPAMLAVAVFSAAGALLLLSVDADKLRWFLPILLIGIAVAYAFLPPVQESKTVTPRSLGLYAATAAPIIGFYDGFFGPGTGMFFALSMVWLAGSTLVEATANSKVLNFVSNIVGLMVLASAVEIYWAVGGVLVLGQMSGAWLGAHSVHRFGGRVIKPVAVVASVAMAVAMLVEN